MYDVKLKYHNPVTAPNAQAAMFDLCSRMKADPAAFIAGIELWGQEKTKPSFFKRLLGWR